MVSAFALLFVSTVRVICSGDVTSQLQAGEGSRIELTEGDCSLAKTVRFCRPTELHGSGLALTRLHVVTGTTGIYVGRGRRCPTGAPGASRSVIADLTLLSPGIVLTGTPTYGLEFEVRGTLRQVGTVGFVNGVRIVASARSKGTNANAWRVNGVLVQNAQHAGLYIDGPDTNAGASWAVEVYGNCRRAGRWLRRLGPCAGYYDSSYLGSTHAAVMGDLQKDRDTGIVYPAHKFEGDSQRSECLGCYNEGDFPSSTAQYTMMLGGLVNTDSIGLSFSGPVMNRLQILNDRDPSNVLLTRFGKDAYPGSGLDVTSKLSSSTLHLRYELLGTSRAWRVDINALNKLLVLRIFNDASMKIYKLVP